MAAGDIIISDGRITPEILEKITSEVVNNIQTTSKDPGQYEEVNSLQGITSIPVFHQSGSTYKLVRVLLSILKGVDGKEVHLQSTETHLQWRWTDGMWENLIAWADLKGEAGDTPEFRTGLSGIEWKYVSEEEAAWKVLVTFEVLKLKFSDLTGENIAEFWRSVPDDVMADFKKPATDAAAEVRKEMVQISKVASQAIKAATDAAGNAQEAADNVKDGKTPVLESVNAESGDTPSGSFTQNGVDAEGNPKYILNLTSPAGKDGQPAIFEQGTTTTLEPTEEARVEVVENGETAEGNPKYILNFFIPRGPVGKPGTGSGNVSVDGTGLLIGKKYLFVPDSDGSTAGSFVEYVAPEIPEQVQPDWEATEGKGAILNKPGNATSEKSGFMTSEQFKKLEKINFVPTLDHEPGENDLTFQDEDGKHTFMIGDQARVLDTDKGEFVFWQLYDIADNKAVWKTTGSGGGADLREHLTIKLVSNQAQPDASLIGAEITVKIAGVSHVLTWQGEDLTMDLDPAEECVVSVSRIDGYSLPAEQKFVTGISNIRSIEFAYNCCVLTIDFDSNQTDKSDIANAQATVKYGDTTKTLTGNMVKVPHGEDVTISYSEVDRYKTPDSISKVFTTANETITARWLTEVVSITLLVKDADYLPVPTRVVVDTFGEKIWLEAMWEGPGTLETKIPYGEEYRIEATATDEYVEPDLQEYTAGIPSRAVEMYYTELRATYIMIDQTTSDPTEMIQGNVGDKWIQWIRDNSHRYLGKYTGDGEMTICQLDDTDSTKFFDGTAANLAGIEGDVFMKLPRFWYAAEEQGEDLWMITFSLDEQEGWHEWDGNDLIGVYEGYIYNNKVQSTTGKDSTDSVSQGNWKVYARNRGNGYSIVKWKHHNIMAFLFYAIYGNTNSQAIVGNGTNVATKATGQTDYLGMTDTVAGVNGDNQSINFWGLENWWGNKYEWIDNVMCNNGLLSITEDDDSVRTIQPAIMNGYVKKMVIGDHLDLIAKTSEIGSDTIGYCDHQQITPNTKRVCRRSGSNISTQGGVSCMDAYYNATSAYVAVGSRLAFRGKIIESKNVEEFRFIPITNN